MEQNAFQAKYGVDNLTGKPIEYYLDAFRRTDPLKISSRLGIPYESAAQSFTVSFLGQVYSVHYPDLQVTGGDLFERNPKARILLLRYLLYASVFSSDGEFRSYREMPSGDLYYNVFYGRCIRRFTKTYAERLPEFRRAAKSMGAVTVSGGDLACEFEIFDNLFIRFLLWEGDAEYPASGQILFSGNFPAAFSAYDLTEIVEIVLGELKKQEVPLTMGV